MGGRGSTTNKRFGNDKADNKRKRDARMNRRMSGGGGGAEPTLGDRMTFTDRLTFTFNDSPLMGGKAREVRETYKKVFKKELDAEGVRNLWKMVGAADGAKVNISGDLRRGELHVEVEHPFYTQERTFKLDKGKLVVENVSFFVKDRYQGQGIGIKVFANQVYHLRQNGVTKIKSDASGEAGMGLNGYYTWAVFGYKGKIPAEVRRRLDTDDDAKAFRNAKDIYDIVSTEAGRDWWARRGMDFEGEFNLSNNSPSMRRLRKYVEDKNVKLTFKL